MTAVTLPNTGIKAGYLPGESGWSDSVNQTLRALDALVQARAIDKDLLAPPTIVSGAVYLIPALATGAWAGKTGQIAIGQAGDDLASAWLYVVPKKGWRIYVSDESTPYEYNGTAWVVQASGGSGAAERNTTTALAIVAGVLTVDVSKGDYFTLTMTAPISEIVITGLPGSGRGRSFWIRITNAGGFSATWPSSFKWGGDAPTLSAAGVVDVLAGTTVNNGGVWDTTLSKGR